MSTAHGERWDDDVAALAQSFVDDGGQVAGVIRVLAHVVETVPVGALGDYIIRFCDILGIADDGLFPVADVPGKDDFSRFLSLGEPQLRAGGTQKMPRVHKTERHPVGDGNFLPILKGDHMAHGFFHVRQGIQWLHRRLARPLPLLVFPLGVALLDVSRVTEHDGQQLPGEPGAVDVAGEALLHQ